MNLATIASRAQTALAAEAVAIEIHLAPGLPGWNIVGLPEAAVRESRDRVRAALQQCGYRVPAQRITVNLAPADLPKEGGRFDLGIALGILVASGQVPAAPLQGIEVLGELSLSGELRAVRGALPAALCAQRSGHGLLLPMANLAEAARVPDGRLHPAATLAEICAALHAGTLPEMREPPPVAAASPPKVDLAEVRGQAQARRALEIAAAGGHSLLMLGPPGSGKSMLAHSLPGLLPPLDVDAALAVAAVYSAAGCFDALTWGIAPFRAPHHSASAAALVGGGQPLRPGEVSLAHHGALFLDELPEWRRDALEVLREPLEAGSIVLSRAQGRVEFPARFQLIAAMNPCPCGYLGDPVRHCRCTPDQLQRYRGRVSGPLLDRIDLQVTVPRPALSELADTRSVAESSAEVRRRVMAARRLQLRRAGCANAALSASALRGLRLDDDAAKLLQRAAGHMALSARGYHRSLRVARSIADLAGAESIAADHVAEALRYRELELE